MPDTVKSIFETEIAALPESLRDGAHNWHLQLIADQPDGPEMFVNAGGDVGGLVHLISCSEFAGTIATRHWRWLCDVSVADGLGRAHDQQTLRTCFDALVEEERASEAFRRRIRIQRNQALLRILWRDLVSRCELVETLTALSDLADFALSAASAFAGNQHRERFGTIPFNGNSMPLVILAMGKLGGRELNFSSDVDIIFLYPGEGTSDGQHNLSAHEYFSRYSRQVVSLLEDVTTDGFVYRVDTRLRPFGASGPPVVSFSALEAYLLQHGRDWERYAYIKARIVVPSAVPASDTDLLEDIVGPFVYRRYLDYGVFASLREMHAYVAAEVRKRDMQDNIKLGPGGIREIEFIVQSLQLIRGGKIAGLRSPELRGALRSSVAARDIQRDVADGLLLAYEFFRRTENRIQAVRDQQIHELPQSSLERDRLALAMRYSSWDTFSADLESHREFVSQQFAAIAIRDVEDSKQSDSASKLATLWSSDASEDEWCRTFDDLEFGEPRQLSRVVARFAASVGKQKIDSIATDRLRKFIPVLLLMLAARPHSSTTLQCIFDIADRVLRRSAYIALLNENQAALCQLMELCEKSSFLAEEIGRFPQLLDELLDRRLYSRVPGEREMRADLVDALDSIGAGDSEQQIDVVSRIQRATLFRLAVADLSGRIPIMKVSDRLSELAEVVLDQCLDVAYRDLVARYGEPQYEIAGQKHIAGFGVIAYGKLGGMELSYGSDLDLVFLHDSTGSQQQTNAMQSIANSDFFARLARRLVHFLTTRGASGILYDIDTRLRPSGQSGLLVISIDAFERYQDENAWTWEHQALLRSRPVAGSHAIGRAFERIRSRTLREKVHLDSLCQDVLAMRQKMRRQLDRSDGEVFDLKQGLGGIGDIEFLVQFLVLANAGGHPAVIFYPDNIRQIGGLVAAGCLREDEGIELQEAYRAYRVVMHRLALDGRWMVCDQGEFLVERVFVRGVWDRVFGATDPRGEVDP